MSTPTAVSGIDTGILLEAGTNEAEVLVFRVLDHVFGVNVAKVREVIPIEQVTEIPRSHPAVDGLVDIREAVVPLVNLAKYLHGDRATQEQPTDTESLMLLELNNQQIAFRVQGIERIFRVSWQDTLPAPQVGDEAAAVTSILRQEGRLVPLLDFESIVATIGIGGRHTAPENAAHDKSAGRSDFPIVFADDSRLVSEMVRDTLVQAGYTNLKGFPDGQEAWDYLSATGEGLDPEAVAGKVACVVTDVEMPRMDGLSLTKKIRQHPTLGGVPVIVFSSIASKDNDKKRKQVGATAQVSKPHYDQLIQVLSEVLAPAAAS